ncbi:DUF4760 domain-containing protein [Rhizobium sp. SL42]|uniref:DUF4760 domain-containing protein n=1 Tax=Rhizobium sp. SL42 TaxID=2806346 RepID=UPI001F17C59E|nr:DUF4760 domain-containing protein [Rhizobium sp. SL42]UJW74454.1 DUF4760 domain-containing protein [Rhizobium sp. SL42]
MPDIDVTTSILANAASIANIVASVAVCATAAFVWRQVSLQSKSGQNDDRRFKRESANYVFEALQSPSFKNSRKIMLDALNAGIELPKDKDQIDGFRYILNTYEMLGLMVKFGAINEEVWEGYWKKALLRDWDRLAKFVAEERKRFKHTTLFEDAETVVKKWRG